jgi:L-2,4-diaminobutyric acid acetyltransferase
MPTTSSPPSPSPRQAAVCLQRPSVRDAAAMWRLVSAVPELDRNSSYAYLLWCRDFAATSVVARPPGEPHGPLVGFVTGYLRPDVDDVLVIWQVAVDPAHRRLGAASAMLDALVPLASTIETTVTPTNQASRGMFDALARRHGATLTETTLFEASDFPDEHEAEVLLRIGPPVHPASRKANS